MSEFFEFKGLENGDNAPKNTTESKYNGGGVNEQCRKIAVMEKNDQAKIPGDCDFDKAFFGEGGKGNAKNFINAPGPIGGPNNPKASKNVVLPSENRKNGTPQNGIQWNNNGQTGIIGGQR